ncbi:MAG: hypothetical protein U0175_34435 [Caldilineaceae bacterium]
MYERLGEVTLKSGERVEAGVVRGPEPTWSRRLQTLLWHKGDPWNWQNAQLLEVDHGLDVNFYVLHREGEPFTNIMTVELAGVGHFGHVWTQPADRQQGASSSLMRLQMQDFAARGGQTLFLGTGYGSTAYRIYSAFGFASIEAESGYMAYYAKSKAEFEATYFAPGPVEVQPLAWPHWPSSAALFLGDYPGLVRCAPLQMFGHASSEGPFLPALIEAAKRQQAGESPTVWALFNPATSAVVGLAAWSWHPLWPDVCLVDCYCHPNFWSASGELLNALQLPTADHTVAYVDIDNKAKSALFTQAGFKATATLPRWLATDHSRQTWTDVVMLEK